MEGSSSLDSINGKQNDRRKLRNISRNKNAKSASKLERRYRFEGCVIELTTDPRGQESRS